MFEKNEDVLITVKAYPNPSKKYTETVCVAGIVPKKGWIRIYPVPYRQMAFMNRFRKYEILNMNLEKCRRDPRPESYRPDIENIKKIRYFDPRYDKGWQKRKEIVLEFVDESMCEIQRQQAKNGKSLGLFKPKEIHDLIIEDVNQSTSDSKSIIYNQLNIFGETLRPLDTIPFKFKYAYCCHHKTCKGHEQTLIDWEIYQLYRNVKKRRLDDIQAIKKDIKDKFIGEIFSKKRDSYFYTGNLNRHHRSFILLGVFWPPK